MLLTGIYVHAHDRTSDTTALYVRHIRDGVELEPLVDTDFVEKTADEAEYPLHVMLEAGDDLLLECVYDNPTDAEINWGSGINDQMCVANFNFVSEGVDGPLSCLDGQTVQVGVLAEVDGLQRGDGQCVHDDVGRGSRRGIS